jgi:hypothetical protein
VVVAAESLAMMYGETSDRAARERPSSRYAFERRWAGRTPHGDERLWRSAGFEVAHYTSESEPEEVRPRRAQPVLTRPVLTRAVDLVSQGPARGLPALRWAIKHSAPAGPAGEGWGDVHFARALAAALSRLGQTAIVDSRAAHHRETAYVDDVVLTIRGLYPVAPQRGGSTCSG